MVCECECVCVCVVFICMVVCLFLKDLDGNFLMFNKTFIYTFTGLSTFIVRTLKRLRAFFMIPKQILFNTSTCES